MDLQQFEQAILKLAFETNARITTAAVAYYLGIPSREANEKLNALLEEGVLELDSDASGNLFYQIPHHSKDGDGTIQQLRVTRDARDAQRDGPPRTQPPPPRLLSPQHFTATADDPDSGGASVSPLRAPERVGPSRPVDSPRPHLMARDDQPQRLGPGPEGRTNRDNWGGFDDYFGAPSGTTGVVGPSLNTVRKPVWASASARVASPDASLDSCGSSSVVVGTQVRCEPKPLPASKPVLVSCNDNIPVALDGGREQLWFGRSNDSTALMEVGETALAREYYIEQPEHQPGMALLLSLILCGTGQIYNGEVSKGIMMMILCFLLWFVLLGWVVHIWSIVDAVVVAERLNRRQA